MVTNCQKVRTLINLHLMTGNIGKPGAGPFSLTGQPNAMGGREAGGLAHILPGYRMVTNGQHRAEVEQFWGLPPGQISPHPGLNAWEMITGLERGAVGCLWIAATNPAVSVCRICLGPKRPCCDRPLPYIRIPTTRRKPLPMPTCCYRRPNGGKKPVQ